MITPLIQTISCPRARGAAAGGAQARPVEGGAIEEADLIGKLNMDDRVIDHLPWFQMSDPYVTREMRIRDLLAHRGGLTYGFINSGPVGNAYRAEGVTDGLTQTDLTLQQNIDRLGAQPLLVQPGTAWNYSLSTDTLGRVVEVVSGTPFDAFLRDRIFKPLGMSETSFDVPDSRWSRFSTVYSPDGSGGIRPMKDPETFGNTRMYVLVYRANNMFRNITVGYLSALSF